VWDVMIDIWAHKLYKDGGILSRGVEYMSAGLDSVPIPAQDFEVAARRITVDTGCIMKTLSPALAMAPKRVGVKDLVETIENDNEWKSLRSVQWLKGFSPHYYPRYLKKTFRISGPN
jgi:hypothetical protein